VNLSAWLQELKHRRVFRALAAYGLVAFALLQVVEPVMHGLNLPEWVLKVVVIGLGLGLPVTSLLAWAYDIRATGIERTASAGPGRGWRTVALVTMGLLLAAPGVTYYLVYRTHMAGVTSVASANATPSIAVLPFADMSEKHDQEYFADGVAEEILNALSHVEGLRVPGRTSSFWFKGKNAKLSEIGRELNVTHVLEGSVRRSGARVRVTAQVVNVADGYHLWSETFDQPEADLFAVQDEVARAVARALAVRLLGGQPLGSRAASTASPEAHTQFLLGQHLGRLGSEGGPRGAAAALERAVALDPGYAPAWAALAQALNDASDIDRTSFPVDATLARSDAAVERAIRLAPDLPDGYVVRAHLRAFFRYDWAGAIADLERALALRPSDPATLGQLGLVYFSQGRLDLASDRIRSALALDPLDRWSWNTLGKVQTAQGRLAEARTSLERAIQLSPEGYAAPFHLGTTWLLEGRPDRMLELSSGSSGASVRLEGAAVAHFTLGQQTEARRALDELEARHAEEWAFQIAEVHAWRGEPDEAFAWLERARRQRDAGVVLMLKTSPYLRSLRADPRYLALLRTLNLPMD
jgi:TolB-like protein/cytochrome c-type biogenesis protein CcmH/NrfG